MTAALALYQKQVNDIIVTVVGTVTHAISLAIQCKEPIPYHTSIRTGEGWVKELLEGHPERIRNELGVHKSVFRILVTELQNAGYHATRNVTVEEQLAIFLYTCVTGLSACHVGEQFQHSNNTISKYISPLTSPSVTDTSLIGTSSKFSSHFHHQKSIRSMFGSPMLVIQPPMQSLKTHVFGCILRTQLVPLMAPIFHAHHPLQSVKQLETEKVSHRKIVSFAAILT